MAFPMMENGRDLYGSKGAQKPTIEFGETPISEESQAGSSDEPINILIVDDEPRNLTVLQSILDDPGYRLVRAQSADEALLALISDQFALLILDVRMPGMTGFELAQMIKERKKTAQVPIIFLTAYYNEDQHVLEGYGAGAVDYLHKPVSASVLSSKVAVFAQLFRKNREAARINEALLAEVTERRRADERLRELNETLELRVSARTLELGESRERLRHAADLAKLTYFDLNYARDQVQTAENFPRIMGFALPAPGERGNAIASAIKRLRGHVITADRARFDAETESGEGGSVRKIEFRILGDDGKERWIESEWHVELGADAKPARVFAANLDITDRKHAEENKKVLMAEVNHRSKNLLAVVQAIVQQSGRGADPTTFAHNLSDRLQGLSANQDLLIKSDWRGIEMPDLVRAQLYHFSDLVGTRILVDGPAARLTAAAAQAIGMAIHELATNAAKHGSLSTSAGKVRLSWDISRDEEPLLAIRWSEEGGPKVSTPTRKGFGYLVIGRIAESAVDGDVEMAFLESGLFWKLTAPAINALETK
jgi:two-component sensor histidine kinase/AmiR/NasT family two-component response regulator